MALISECMDVDIPAMAGCLVNPGSGAAPGGSWGDVPAATCNQYDRKGMVECLTGAGDECCFVLGINGCGLMIDGQLVTIF